MKGLLTSILLSILIMFPVFGQDTKQLNMRMYLDLARFRYDEKNTYLEIYYLLYDLSRGETAESEDVWLQFTLTETKKDSILTTSEIKVSLDQKNFNNKRQSNVKGSLIKTVLPKGDYRIKMVRLSDDKTQRVDSLSREFYAPSFEIEKIGVSDLELCSNIITGSSNEKAVFYKNTMEVFPNPMRMYGDETPMLYYYIELYNVDSEDSDGKINIEVAIADTDGNIKAQKSYIRPQSHESLVEVGSFNVSKFTNGLYTLIFAVTDSTSDYSVYTRNNFYVMNQKVTARSDDDLMTLFAQSEFFNMPEDEVDERFQQIHYIITKEQINIYKRLDTVESKRLFLFKFWREKEREAPGLRWEYYSRVEYANEHFAFSNRKGWKSDRGRIYITYGEPSYIARYPHEPDMKPFIIWTYHELEGGAKFLFADDSGFGDYKLMSSTMRGEIRDPNYDKLLLFDQ